ncbi:hypothetical protein GCM10023238_31570 [Streptomyces heliomycini]
MDEAAAATDDPKAAAALLTAYAEDARITDVTLTSAPAPAPRSPSAVKGTVSYEGAGKRWRTTAR